MMCGTHHIQIRCITFS